MVRRGMEKIVRFGTFNIQNGRNEGLESALCGLVQEQVDCRVIQETKLANGVYMRESRGFCVMVTAEPSSHHGGVATFYREAENFAIEESRLHCPNVISFQLVIGRWRWHVVGFYITLDDALTI